VRENRQRHPFLLEPLHPLRRPQVLALKSQLELKADRLVVPVRHVHGEGEDVIPFLFPPRELDQFDVNVRERCGRAARGGLLPRNVEVNVELSNLRLGV
jgi:hypothetical protein